MQTDVEKQETTERTPAAGVLYAAVIGAGTMGRGIAQALASAKVITRLFDADRSVVDAAVENVRGNLDKGLAKGKVTTATRDAVLACLKPAGDMDEALADVQVVVEAVPESLELKQRLFGDLGGRLGPDVLLATNTSSLPVSRIAEASPHPASVVGMHFFNPVHIMKLVEVVRAEQSAPERVELAVDLVRRMDKEPIVVKDAPGFASSRLGVAIGLEAMRMAEEGVAGVDDIDKAMVLGYGFPMGPLKLTDLVGLDVRLAIAEHLERELGPRFAPPQLLRDKVARGELGQKSGRGFYDWS
jgi:3-hydroxybutyryl-CoA dehydrogenase